MKPLKAVKLNRRQNNHTKKAVGTNRRLSLFIQHPHSVVKIRRKGHPQKIGYLQQSRELITFVKLQYHNKNQYPQTDKPEKCKTVCLKVKEKYAPEEIEKQLQRVNNHTAVAQP